MKISKRPAHKTSRLDPDTSQKSRNTKEGSIKVKFELYWHPEVKKYVPRKPSFLWFIANRWTDHKVLRSLTATALAYAKSMQSL